LSAFRLGIVVAVRNEALWIGELLASIGRQEGLQDVCCIAAVDGRSEDDSRAILEEWKTRLPTLRVLDNERRIAPVGFNLGIRACLSAGAEVVLLVSGHSRLHDGFFNEVQRVLGTDDAAVVGCVLDYPPPASAFEWATQSFVESRLGRRMGAYSRLDDVTETEIATFPAIRRQVFDRVGFFDETMIRNQDIDFTSRARRGGFRVVTAPRLRCQYSPPTSLKRLLRQMYGNGVWVGRRLSAHGARHLAPAVFYGTLLAASILAVLLGRPWTFVIVALAGSYLLAILLAVLTWVPRARMGAAWLLLAFLGGHAAYALGTFQGLLSRGGAHPSNRTRDRETAATSPP
jgi:GT2 family glycosyltransferase